MLKKILLVEDDVIVQRVHQLMLNKLGYEVDIASNGAEAIKKAQENGYGIIFLDIGLPDIAGFDVIREIKTSSFMNGNHTPIIALTGYDGPDERRACLDAGATEIVYKPIVYNTLRNLLERYKLETQL